MSGASSYGVMPSRRLAVPKLASVVCPPAGCEKNEVTPPVRKCSATSNALVIAQIARDLRSRRREPFSSYGRALPTGKLSGKYSFGAALSLIDDAIYLARREGGLA